MQKTLNLFFFIIILSACQQTSPPKTEAPPSPVDSMTLISNFICGLWSQGDINGIQNDGYYFTSDGQFNVVASTIAGNWNLSSRDSLQLSFPTYLNGPLVEIFHIDSLAADRMILTGSSGRQIFRKVPFGMNAEGLLLSGFMGTIAPGISKNYSFELPGIKKIKLEMVCENPNVTFRFFDDQAEITKTEVRTWEGIMIKNGKFRVTVNRPLKGALSDEAVDFNLKVFTY